MCSPSERATGPMPAGGPARCVASAVSTTSGVDVMTVGQNDCDAVLGQDGRHLPQPMRLGGDVHPGRAVHLDVDQPRRHPEMLHVQRRDCWGVDRSRGTERRHNAVNREHVPVLASDQQGATGSAHA